MTTAAIHFVKLANFAKFTTENRVIDMATAIFGPQRWPA